MIAEGITDPAQLAALVEAAGCRFGQGSLFGWGVPAEHLEAMLERTSPAPPGCRPARQRAAVPRAAARMPVDAGPGDTAARRPQLADRCRVRRSTTPTSVTKMWEQLTQRVRCVRLSRMSSYRSLRVLT